MLTLGAWGNAWIEYQLDPNNGRWKVRKLPVANSTENPVGFASVEPLWGVWRRFYAFYAHEGRLYFQAGRRKWDITNGVTGCKFWAAGFGLVSGLILKFENGQSHHPFLIHPLRGLRAHIDPTYDGMDAEEDHFFLFIRQQLPDPKWRQGFIDREKGLREAAA